MIIGSTLTAAAHRTQPQDCQTADRLRIVDGLCDEVIIRGADASEIRLHGFRVDRQGYSASDAQVTVSDDTELSVPRPEGPAEARFSRNAEVAVGEPFTLLLYYTQQERSLVITIGKVEMIAICPSVGVSD